MKRKVIATLAVPILLALLVICGYNYNVDSTQATESSLTDELQSVYVTSQPDKSYDVVVFGTSSQCVAVESSIAGFVQNQPIVSYSSNKPILGLIYEGWIKENPVDAPNIIKKLVDEKSAVAVVNAPFDWGSLGISMSYPHSANVVSVVKTNTGTSSYSCICDSDEEAMSRLMAWSDSIFASSVEPMSSQNPYDAVYESIHDYESRGYGWTSIRSS